MPGMPGIALDIPGMPGIPPMPGMVVAPKGDVLAAEAPNGVMLLNRVKQEYVSARGGHTILIKR
jgi:hypothetical protein